MRRNKERDVEATRLARELGWTVVRVWECEISTDAAAVATEILGNPVQTSLRREP